MKRISKKAVKRTAEKPKIVRLTEQQLMDAVAEYIDNHALISGDVNIQLQSRAVGRSGADGFYQKARFGVIITPVKEKK